MKTMIAKYPGICARTGAKINPGDTILWERKGVVYLSDLLPPEGETYAAPYIRRAKSVSNVFNFGGNEFYRNRAGRCEDAPCCGCCNI